MYKKKSAPEFRNLQQEFKVIFKNATFCFIYVSIMTSDIISDGFCAMSGLNLNICLIIVTVMYAGLSPKINV